MNQRDLELLSSYLDGQLKPSDSARLEARLASDPNLRSILDDLRGARGLLRKLPMRKAPRNFMLTPKMVGKNPPLPRTYPAFKFVTALAAVLLFFTFGVNFLAPQMSASPYAFGRGGGGAPESNSAQAPAAPAATEAPMLAATQAPAATEAPAQPAAGLAPMATATLAPAQDTARAAEKNAATAEAGAAQQTQPQIESAPPQPQPQPPAKVPTPVPPIWQITLAGVVLLGIVVMLSMRRMAAERWRK